MTYTSKVRTCLWFSGDGEDAVNFYISLLPDSYIETVSRPDPDAPPLVIEFRLSGVPYMVLNVAEGPSFSPSEFASISVLTKDQQETDALWEQLTANGGEESMCAWLKDRYGVSWQIVPEQMAGLLAHEDKEAAGRVRAAMMQMRKIDIAALEAAFHQK